MWVIRNKERHRLVNRISRTAGNAASVLKFESKEQAQRHIDSVAKAMGILIDLSDRYEIVHLEDKPEVK